MHTQWWTDVAITDSQTSKTDVAIIDSKTSKKQKPLAKNTDWNTICNKSIDKQNLHSVQSYWNLQHNQKTYVAHCSDSKVEIT